MKLKSAIKYQAFDSIKPLVIFYAIIYAIIILIYTIDKQYSISGYVSGLETTSMVFIFIFGILTFNAPFKLFLQNGISRRTCFFSIIITLMGVAVLMSGIDNINYFIEKNLMAYQSIFDQIYCQQYLADSVLKSLRSWSWAWFFTIYWGIAMLGLLISTLYYRMNNWQKIVVSIGVPVGLFVVIPIISSAITNGALLQAIMKFFSFAFGLSNGFNPHIAVIFNLLFIVILAAINYLLIRRATIKE
ncbi:MAG: hypothetical protein ACOX7H_03935 [Bacillota bacterium]|jgi:hypothetical protein